MFSERKRQVQLASTSIDFNEFSSIYPFYIEGVTEFNPSCNIHESFLQLQSYDLFRKYVPVTGSAQTAERAIDTFLQCEDVCFYTNCRILSGAEYYLNDLLVRAKVLCKQILGVFQYSELLESVRHSGGASVARRRRHGNPVYKVLNHEVTLRSRSLLTKVIRDIHVSTDYGWSLSDLSEIRVFDYNRISTVPKSNQTDRPIGLEPSGNMFLQLGLGKMLRRRLRRFGIDLNDQSRNRNMARLGSISQCYCTIDLSSASDTISYEIVKSILPEDWFDYFDLTRCEQSLIDVGARKGQLITNQKFSSMGNGFTFELESLIFYCVVLAAIYKRPGEECVSVFGDDIIAENKDYERIAMALEACGFTVNQDKSFYRGPFRESCGGNFINGYDITPLRIKRDICDDTTKYWLYNSLYRQHKHISKPGQYFGLARSMNYVRTRLSARDHFFIPDGIGDTGLITANRNRMTLTYDSELQSLMVKARVVSFPTSRVGGTRAFFSKSLDAYNVSPISSCSSSASSDILIQDQSRPKLKNKKILLRA